MNRRMRHVWVERLAQIPGALLHFTLTVPPALRAGVTKATQFRQDARSVVERWLRTWCDVPTGAKLFVFDVMHPAGDGDPSEWAPHANVFVRARAFAGGRLLPIRAFAPKEALTDLRERWSARLALRSGQPAEPVVVHLKVWSNARDQRRALMRELRSFPGWLVPVQLKGLRWAGAFGPRVWRSVREALTLDVGSSGRCEAARDGDPFALCGAPRVPFVTLPAEARDVVCREEDARGERIVQSWERSSHEHTRLFGACSCESCRRAQHVCEGAANTVRAARVVADLAREIATDQRNAALFAAGGPLAGRVDAVRAAYDALSADARTVSVVEVREYRQTLAAFIEDATREGAEPQPGDGEKSVSARRAGLYERRRWADLDARDRTGRWHLTVNLSWVRPFEPR